MQVRPAAVAGVAGARQRRADLDPLALGDQYRMAHQVQVDAHGAVVVQDADEVARGIVAAPALVVLDLHHGAAAGSDDRRALGHGDVHRVAALGGEVAVLAIGALGQAERPAAPGQRIAIEQRLLARVAERVTQLRGVAHRLAGLARRQGRQAHLAARRDHPANRPVGHPNGIARVADPQLDLDRRVEVVAHLQGLATRVLLRLQLHFPFQVLDHPVAEDEHLRPGHGAVGVGHHAIGVGVLVDGQGRSRSCRGEQATEKEKAP